MNINQLLKKITENYKNLEIKLPETKKNITKYIGKNLSLKFMKKKI